MYAGRTVRSAVRAGSKGPAYVRRLFVAFAAILMTAATLSAQLQRRTYAEATALPESENVHAGTTVRLAARVKIADGFHIQSNRPLDPSLIPARLFLDTPPGIQFTGVVFPPSIDFVIAGDPGKVFEGTILVGATITIPKDQAAGTITIPGHFRYQACNDQSCFAPTTAELGFPLTVTGPGTPIRKINAEAFKAIDFRKMDPPPTAEEAKALVISPKPPAAEPGAATTDVLALLDKFDIRGTAGGFLGADAFVKFVNDAENGVKSKGPFEGRGPLAILAIVFLGGLALNLTPCVLPMIPINLAIIGAGAQSKNKGRGFVLGAAYGAAMAIVYGVLGLIVILTAGTFGAINSTLWFNIGIAALFVVLGLAMFDVIAIDFTRWSSRITFDQERRGSVLLAFSMGALAALLAGACVAPVVIQVVVFASNMYAGGTSAALALPFVLGVGMAVPWPIAGAGMAKLPKPGAWMVRVKQAMGVFILGTAIYYGYVAYEIASARWVDPASVQASVDEQLKEGWYASPAEGLQVALRDRTPVLIDFWATWCKNCLVMDKTTLQDAGVKTALTGYTKIKYQAEAPDASPAKEVLQKVGGVGLPTYVVLTPKQD